MLLNERWWGRSSGSGLPGSTAATRESGQRPAEVFVSFEYRARSCRARRDRVTPTRRAFAGPGRSGRHAARITVDLPRSYCGIDAWTESRPDGAFWTLARCSFIVCASLRIRRPRPGDLGGLRSCGKPNVHPCFRSQPTPLSIALVSMWRPVGGFLWTRALSGLREGQKHRTQNSPPDPIGTDAPTDAC